MKTETITCACGTVFQWIPDTDDKRFVELLRPKACPECEELEKAERLEAMRREREEERERYVSRAMHQVNALTPAIFRSTDLSHSRFNAPAWQLVNEWIPTFEKPWLGLIGDTGTSKTRIAYLLAALEIERQARKLAEKTTVPNVPTFAFIASYEITDLASKLSASDFCRKNEARDALDKLRRVDLLLIDDLGKGRLSPSVATELFAIIDHRYANALPMIWTANSTPEIIAANLSEDMAAPFAGRLHDSSRIVRFK
jgi:DNA replication protein DnaC